MAAEAKAFFYGLQDTLCARLEELDGQSRFREDLWNHETGGMDGRSGGGRTRVIADGGVFEKGGVNVSAITSPLTATIAQKMNVQPQSVFATGISLVLHPKSPMIPTVHMNLRHLSLENGKAWFGGGTDLTPYYLFPEDARHFHNFLREPCERYKPGTYATFKKWCDEYFHLPHRRETRGIGGIFFDYLSEDAERVFLLVRELGSAFLAAYEPIVSRRRSEPWGDAERRWQELRRGRYVEFNLVYDRGTLFGLETGGRTESILMSLPPSVRWDYDSHPAPGSREAALLDVLSHPQAWL